MMDEEKLVEAVRTFDCLWKASAKVYRDARECVESTLLRTQSEYGSHPHTSQPCSSLLPPAQCRSPPLHVLETMEPRVNTVYFGLTFGVQCARMLYCEQRYASIGVA